MDWLFEKNKNNAEHLITILANESTSKEIYVKEPIRLFIELMWVKFKPRIIVFVFVPYVVYLSLLYTLTGHLLNSFLINLAEMRFMKEVCVYENDLNLDRIKHQQQCAADASNGIFSAACKRHHPDGS